jgi:hypothetical protein
MKIQVIKKGTVNAKPSSSCDIFLDDNNGGGGPDRRV